MGSHGIPQETHGKPMGVFYKGANLEPTHLVHSPSNLSTSEPPLQEGEHHGGCPFTKENNPHGMVPSSPGGQTGLQRPRHPTHRPFCLSPQQSTTGLLLSTCSAASLGHRRPEHQLVGLPGVCLPPHLPSTQSPIKDRPREVQDNLNSPPLATTTMVPSTSGPPHSTSHYSAKTTRPFHTTRVQDVTPRSGQSSSLCLDAIKSSLQTAGLSKDAASLAAKCRRPSTRRTYDNRLQHFFKWCAKEGFDPSSASITVIGDFLLHIFNSGLQINTIRGYRSAIAVVHQGFDDGSTLSNNTAISQLIKGMFLERPPIKKLTPSWDLGTVLHRLTKPPFEPAGSSSLHNLTVKTVFLLAASTARHRSEIHALSIEPGHLR